MTSDLSMADVYLPHQTHAHVVERHQSNTYCKHRVCVGDVSASPAGCRLTRTFDAFYPGIESCFAFLKLPVRVKRVLSQPNSAPLPAFVDPQPLNLIHVQTSSPHCDAPPRLHLGRPRIITTPASSCRAQHQPAAAQTPGLPCQRLWLPWGLRHTRAPNRPARPALGVPHRDRWDASLLLA